MRAASRWVIGRPQSIEMFRQKFRRKWQERANLGYEKAEQSHLPRKCSGITHLSRHGSRHGLVE